jgi:transmembrane protein TMEM260 (protein O-mannosyltransferase)
MVSPRLVAVGAPLLVAALVILNAWSGLMPGVGFWDTGEFQTVLPIMGTAHPTGYPTYVLLGFVANLVLTPIGEPAFRITALSLLAVATAAGATVVLVRRLTSSTIVGIATGLGLATTPVVWLNATRADPHSIHLAFVALLLLALVRWEQGRRALREGAGSSADPAASAAYEPTGAAAPGRAPEAAREPAERRVDRWLVLAAILFGLAAGNHSLTLLLVPPIGLYVLAVDPGIWRRPILLLACLAAVALTVTLVYLELPIRGGLLPAPLIYGRPDTWDGFWYIALAEQFRGSLGDPFANLATKLDHVVAFARDQYGLLALAIPPALIVAARRAPRYTLLSGLALVITILFNEAYSNADIQRYYLGPVLWVWTWLGILGAEVADLVAFSIAGLVAGRRSLTFDTPTARVASIVAATIVGVVLLLPALGDVDARRTVADRSHDTGAATWLDEALPALAENAVLVSWWSTSTPLWYAQKVQGLRPDVFIADDRTMIDLGLGRAPDVIRRYLGTRPVYAIRLQGHDIDELLDQFDMTLVASGGNTAIYRVNGLLAATP